MEKFKYYLLNCDYSEVYNAENVNSSYNKFMEIYKNGFEENFPLKLHSTKNKHIKQQAWMTTGLLTSSRYKHKLYIKKLNRPTEHNTNKYKNYVKIFNQVKRFAKKNFYGDMLNKHKNNMKESWKIINQLIKKKKQYKLPTYFEINNEHISDNTEIANTFNTFFNNIGPDVYKKIPHTDKDFTSYLNGNYPRTFFMTPVDPAELVAIAKNLKSKSSSGHDNISSKLMKETILEIS